MEPSGGAYGTATGQHPHTLPLFPQPVRVVVQLPTSNAADLNALLARQADPASPDYRKWLSPAELAAQFGPSPAQVAAATASLQAAGFSVSQLGSSSLLATGPPAAVEAAFNTTLVTVQEAVAPPMPTVPASPPSPLTGGATALDGSVVPPAPADANTTDVLKATDPLRPSAALNLPPGTAVAGPPVVGQPLIRTGAVKKELPPLKTSGYVASVKSYAYWGADLRQAYRAPALSTGITGAGRTVCNLMAGDVLDSDGQTYFAVQNLSPPSITRVPVLGGCTRAACPGESGEMILDVSAIGGAAPGAAIRIYSIPSLYTVDILTGLAQILSDNVCDIVNMSFGLGEGYPGYQSTAEPTEALFQAGNAQGITFVAISGDYGSNYCVSNDQGVSYTYPCATYPGSSPAVTSVGGTNLVAGPTSNTGVSGTSNSAYVFENAWPYYLLPTDFATFTQSGYPATAGGAWGSGGGVSAWFPTKPAYQNLVSTGYSAATSPDVSGMMGSIGAPVQCQSSSCDSAYFVIEDNTIGLQVGTSGSSPFFAGILALAQQYEGGVRFGNVNYKLYADYAAERDPKAAVLAKVGVTPVNVSQAVDAKAAAAAAGKPDWAASKIQAAAAEVTAINAKVAAKERCVTRQSAAGPLAEKVKLCAFNDDIPGSNGVYYSGDGAGGYSLVLGLGTVNIDAFLSVKKVPLSGPWVVNTTALAGLTNPYNVG